MIRNTKRLYYENKFERAKKDLKETWNLINEIINKRKAKPSLPSSFNVDGKMVTDPLDIANGFVNTSRTLALVWPEKSRQVIVLFGPFYQARSMNPLS